ncbi:MAG: hypothetical protein OXC57_13875 [Rhodobacteraceae bacterium]|nr:hypothetical protein [Paracoccaceae bacterium]
MSEVMEEGSISAYNLSEVVANLIKWGVPMHEASYTLKSFELEVLPVDENIASLSGSLISVTNNFGLVLGDRMCLATGIFHSKMIITTNKVWREINYGGLDVIIFG